MTLEYIGTVDFLKEYCRIRRDLGGNETGNAEMFVKRVFKALPDQAAAISLDISDNMTAAIEVSGLPKTALLRIARWLRGAQ